MKWIIDTQKRDTKLPQIIRAAVKLFVEKGIDATTTKEIAEAAHVAEGTIYRHFKSKDDMAYAVFLTHLEAFTDELQKAADPVKSTKEKLRAIIFCYFTFFETERTLFEYILATEHRELRNYPVTLRQPVHVIHEILQGGMDSGEIPQQNITFTCAYIIGMVQRVSIFRLYNRIPELLINHVDEVTAACWNVVKNTEGRN